MIVWRDKQHRRQATPPWLVGLGERGPARVGTFEHGDLLCAPEYVAMLGWRPGVEWHDVEDGWAAALYGDPAPTSLLRRIHWALVAEVQDARGVVWLVPAILHPDGMPAINQIRRLTAQGWERAPATDLARAAVEACQQARPLMERWHELSLEEQANLFGPVWEAVYHCSALTAAKLGLWDDLLLCRGMQLATGRLDLLPQPPGPA